MSLIGLTVYILGFYFIRSWDIDNQLRLYASRIEGRTPITAEFLQYIEKKADAACLRPLKSIHLWEYDDTLWLYYLHADKLLRLGDSIIPFDTRRAIKPHDMYIVKCLLERFRSLKFAREVMSLFCGHTSYIPLLQFIEQNRHRYR